MLNSHDARRRWFGAFFLIVAGGMLLWGITLLQPYLHGMTFVIYWLVCFGFTGLAILTALIDAIVMRKRTREQHRNLVRKTFEDDPELLLKLNLQDSPKRR